MLLDMLLLVTFIWESLVTNTTFKCFFSCMWPLMDHQIPFISGCPKWFWTNGGGVICMPKEGNLVLTSPLYGVCSIFGVLYLTHTHTYINLYTYVYMYSRQNVKWHFLVLQYYIFGFKMAQIRGPKHFYFKR